MNTLTEEEAGTERSEFDRPIKFGVHAGKTSRELANLTPSKPKIRSRGFGWRKTG